MSAWAVTRRHATRAVERATAGRRALPDYVIIGAAKCGTTSLFRYLHAHPGIQASAVKEVHFVDSERNFARGERWYRSWFPAERELVREGRAQGIDRALSGEATPNYLAHPDAPVRLHSVVPDARLIVLLRNPVDRAWSQYRWRRRHGDEPLSFADAVAAEPERLPAGFAMMREPAARTRFLQASYLTRGRYAEQLRLWLDHYDRAQVLLLRSEDLFDDPAAVYHRTCAFLGLAPGGSPDLAARNTGDEVEEMDPALRRRLEDQFAEPNRELAELTDGVISWPRRLAT